MSDTPIQPGKYYRLGKLRFEHQLNGRWGAGNGMFGVGGYRTPIGAWVGLCRTRHATVRFQRMLVHLRLYAPTMKALHRFGQCFMITKPGPESLRRECMWCGTKAKAVR